MVQIQLGAPRYPHTHFKLLNKQLFSMPREDIAGKLSTEHEMVFKTINSLEDALSELLKKTLNVYEVDKEQLKDYACDFMEYFNKNVSVHFSIEEDVVFPELRGEGLVDELLKEHREIRTTFKNLIVAEDVETKLKLLREVMDMLRRHAEKEDSQLLPLIKSKIPAEKLPEIMEKTRKLLNQI